jgi:hypothetical protein
MLELVILVGRIAMETNNRMDAKPGRNPMSKTVEDVELFVLPITSVLNVVEVPAMPEFAFWDLLIAIEICSWMVAKFKLGVTCSTVEVAVSFVLPTMSTFLCVVRAVVKVHNVYRATKTATTTNRQMDVKWTI